AQALAERCGFRFNTMDNLMAEITDADIIVSSVSGDDPLITRVLMDRISIHSHKYFIDLSIPRSIEPSIEEIPGAIVYNLDDIQEKTTEAVKMRKAAVPQVQNIIREAM